MVDDKHLPKASLAGSLGNVEHLPRPARITLLCAQIVNGAGGAVEALLLVIPDERQAGRTSCEIIIGSLLEQIGLVLDLVARAVIPVADIEVVFIILFLGLGFFVIAFLGLAQIAERSF